MMNLRVFCFPKSSKFQGKESINVNLMTGFQRGAGRKLCKLERGQIMQQWPQVCSCQEVARSADKEFVQVPSKNEEF